MTLKHIDEYRDSKIAQIIDPKDYEYQSKDLSV